jgi:hypothetical protein
MIKTLLLVTWLGTGGASSYQVEFIARHYCEEARDALIKDAQRLGVPISAVCVSVDRTLN